MDTEFPDEQPLDPEFAKNPSSDITPELYGGHRRGCTIFGYTYIGHSDYCRHKDELVDYTDPDKHDKHRMYFQGPWFNDEENIRHGRETLDYEDYMYLKYAARSVNLVLNADNAPPFKVLVTLDGSYLDQSNKGEDVTIEEDGRSFVYADKPRLYRVVETPSYGTHELKLASTSADFAIYAFTFGVYKSGP